MHQRGFALCFEANDPSRLADFWAHVLGRELITAPETGFVLPANDTLGFAIRFESTDRSKRLQNWAHFDLTSTSREDQKQIASRALDLGGRHIDIGQGPDADHVVMADPESNEFCVIEPGSTFLADTGVIGALACDGSQAVGYFWSKALGWPLVWDQDQETAVQSLSGGPKITWGGPPPMQRDGRDRLRYDLIPPAGADLGAEVERLVSLKATRLDTAPDSTGRVPMTDPDGNEFTVTPAS